MGFPKSVFLIGKSLGFKDNYGIAWVIFYLFSYFLYFFSLVIKLSALFLARKTW